MLDFYYDFSIDIETKTIKIGIDQKYEFQMIYPYDCNFEPRVEPLEDGSYRVEFKNIFKKIDITYFLKSSSIKEEIKIWEKKYCKDFCIKFKHKNCLLFYDKKSKEYKILGKNQVELFSFSKLKVIYEEHNKSSNLDGIASLEVDELQGNMLYRFFPSSYSEELFPVIIDPTFNFRTTIRRVGAYVNTDFDRNNYMIVSGKTIADDFFDSAVGLPAGRTVIGATPDHYTHYSPPGSEYYKKILSSDDVIFEKNCRLMFPYLTDLIAQVNVVVTQDGIETVIGTLPIKSTFVNNIRYDYVDFKFAFNLPSTVKIEALVTLDKYRYGDFNVLYSRVLTLIPEVNLKINNTKNFITKKGTSFSGAILICSSLETFKPKRIDLIPFQLDFTKAQEGSSIEEIRNSLYRQKDKTNNFVVDATKVETASTTVNYYYDFPNINIEDFPNVRDTDQEQTSTLYLRRGSSQSFYNKAEVIFVSGINNRSNIQEDIEFLRPYRFISPDDFYFDISPEEAVVSGGRISLNKNNFKLFSYQKPTHYIKTKNGEKFLNNSDISISYSSKDNETRLVLNDIDNFFIFEFSKSSNPFVPAKVNVTFKGDRSPEDIGFKILKDDVLAGSFAIVRSGGNLNSYKIKGNDGNSITFAENISSGLKNADYIGFFPYLPDEISFIFEHITYDVERKNLVRASIVESTGDISFRPVLLQIEPNAPSSILANFRERGGDFGGISKEVSIRNESTFYFFGFDSSTVKIKAFIEQTKTTDIINVTPQKINISSGGVVFNNLYVPSKYKDRILYLEVDAPGFADKVALDIYDKEGKLTEYTGNISEVIEFIINNPDENRFVEIRINQTNLEYSKILIKFVNI